MELRMSPMSEIRWPSPKSLVGSKGFVRVTNVTGGQQGLYFMGGRFLAFYSESLLLLLLLLL